MLIIILVAQFVEFATCGALRLVHRRLPGLQTRVLVLPSVPTRIEGLAINSHAVFFPSSYIAKSDCTLSFKVPEASSK